MLLIFYSLNSFVLLIEFNIYNFLLCFIIIYIVENLINNIIKLRFSNKSFKPEKEIYRESHYNKKRLNITIFQIIK